MYLLRGTGQRQKEVGLRVCRTVRVGAQEISNLLRFVFKGKRFWRKKHLNMCDHREN